MNRPISAPRSSSSTTGSSGLRLVRMNRHHDWSPLSGRDSRIAVRNDHDSSPIASTRMMIATVSGSCSASGCALISWYLWMPS